MYFWSRFFTLGIETRQISINNNYTHLFHMRLSRKHSMPPATILTHSFRPIRVHRSGSYKHVDSKYCAPDKTWKITAYYIYKIEQDSTSVTNTTVSPTYKQSFVADFHDTAIKNHKPLVKAYEARNPEGSVTTKQYLS